VCTRIRDSKFITRTHTNFCKIGKVILYLNTLSNIQKLDYLAGPKFDVIIMDICDPIEAGPGVVLYFQEFYQSIAKCVSNFLIIH
jgi:hypothetical protein